MGRRGGEGEGGGGDEKKDEEEKEDNVKRRRSRRRWRRRRRKRRRRYIIRFCTCTSIIVYFKEKAFQICTSTESAVKNLRCLQSSLRVPMLQNP
jgi:hypothetical protein